MTVPNASTRQAGSEGAPKNAPAVQPGKPLLEVKNLKMHFPITKGLFSRVVGHVKAVDDVSFSVFEGETLGLVGESGCGKTTTGRCLLRVYEPTDGELIYHEASGKKVDLMDLGMGELKPYRRQIRMIFQDPHSSLNPRMPVLDIIGEPLRVNHLARGRELEDRVADLMRKVGLRPEYMRRYPHAFSGGERQRIGIARALAVNPRLVVCDEAVSALDVSVQAQVLELLDDIQQRLGIGLLFITHDLRVAAQICDDVMVMQHGNVVEYGPAATVLGNPKTDYTRALIDAAPGRDWDFGNFRSVAETLAAQKQDQA